MQNAELRIIFALSENFYFTKNYGLIQMYFKYRKLFCRKPAHTVFFHNSAFCILHSYLSVKSKIEIKKEVYR